MNKNKKKKCCLCGEPIEGFGNNPWPLANESECCETCACTRVLHARMGMEVKNNMKKGITKEQALQVIADHINLGDLRTVKHDDGTYIVFAECSDGLVEIKPNERQ